MKYHITKDNRKILLKDLESSHILNILKWIKKQAITGLTIKYGGGSTAEDIWYEEETIYGEKVLNHLHYNDYKTELNKRFGKFYYE